MRPDEHKKKKSIQYQKKHGGISKQDKKDDENKSVRKHKANPHVPKNEKQTTKLNELRDSDSSVSSDEEDQKTRRAPQFSRRKVTSNWDRYEVIPDEDPNIGPTQRGEDFNKLLQSAGAAASQFRFKDEELWEDGEGSQSDHQYLSVDLNSLADSLSCLPVYQRLQLDKKIFSVDQIECMDNDAQMCREKFNSDFNSDITCSTGQKIIQNGDKMDSKTKIKTIESEKDYNLPNNCDKTPKSGKMKILGVSNNDMRELNTNEGNVMKSTEVSEESKIMTNKQSITCIDDDGLDFLLSLDTPNSKEVTIPDEEFSVNKSLPVKDKVSEKSGTKTGKGSSQEEDLEDWLDSILDE